jgi:diguanylate cyclase
VSGAPHIDAGRAAFLGFELLMMAALIAAVRGHARGLASSVWLDASVGSLGAAAVLAVVLSPVLASDSAGCRATLWVTTCR